MARRWTHGLALLPLLAGPGCAQQTLLCRRPEVVQEVGRVVKLWNVYNTVDEYTAMEAPTAQANAVRCQAVLTTVAYDPTRTGWAPRHVRELVRYDVQVSGNRFSVQMAP